jgi:hypothetical protein
MIPYILILDHTCLHITSAGRCEEMIKKKDCISLQKNWKAATVGLSICGGDYNRR